MLLRKSARDGSAIGQLTLGNAYLDGALGFSMSLKDAHDQLVKVEEGPYRLPAARSLYDIYAEPNQPLFSPEKATAEMERMHAASKDLAFVGPLVLIYSGKQFGEKGESVKSQDKLDLLIADLEKQNRPQAIAMVEFSLGRVTGDQIIKTMLQAVKADPIEPAFGKVFCSAMSASYFSKNSDSDLNLDDLIKSCMPEAEQNVSTAQLILAAAYGKKGEYRDAYKWAYISYLNGNKQAFALATGIATMNLRGDVDHLNQEAIKAQSGYESASDAHTGSEVLRYYLPWYAPSRTADAGKN